jgi:hypothetical protein
VVVVVVLLLLLLLLVVVVVLLVLLRNECSRGACDFLLNLRLPFHASFMARLQWKGSPIGFLDLAAVEGASCLPPCGLFSFPRLDLWLWLC